MYRSKFMSVAPVALDTPTSSSGQTSFAEGTISEGVREFNINGTNFKFDLAGIKVKKGDTVKINFTNRDGMHDFVLDGLNIRTKVLKLGETESITFVADKAGSFEYYCSIGQHRQMGMKGTLVVTE